MASNAIESQGVTLSWKAETVGEVLSFSGPGGSAAIIDKTNLASTAREKMMGLPDEGQLTMEVSLDPTDDGQVQLRTDRVSRTRREAILTLTDATNTTLTFNAYCLGFAISGSVDDKITASITLEIDGAVTWNTPTT